MKYYHLQCPVKGNVKPGYIGKESSEQNQVAGPADKMNYFCID